MVQSTIDGCGYKHSMFTTDKKAKKKRCGLRIKLN